jgi:hypothetical protein
MSILKRLKIERMYYVPFVRNSVSFVVIRRMSGCRSRLQQRSLDTRRGT